MGKAPRSSHGPRGYGPGPGQYESGISAINTKRGIAIKGRGNPNRHSIDGPGPGAYSQDYDPTRSKAPAYKIGGRNQRLNYTMTPGPDYNPNLDAVKSKAPTVGFGSGKRNGMGGADGPGPGNYNLGDGIGGNGGFKIGGRH